VSQDDELTETERRALDAFPAMPPPPGFADRVLAAREASPVPPRRRWPYLAAGGVAAACAAATLAYVATRPASQAASGSLEATARTEAPLGRRAVAVAEANAAIRWRIDDDGATAVEHTTGNVFYRVDRGGPFVVHTPAGDVRVTGTCFRVEVTPMSMSKKHVLASGAAGAVLAAAVVVTVYEGHVIAETRAARTELSAGTQAAIGADGRATVAAISPTESAAAARTLAEDRLATRDELVARTGEQRAEIARLRTRVAQLEKAPPPGSPRAPDNSSEEGRAWYDPSPERLAQWAAECHIRADSPGFDRYQPMPANQKNDRGIEPSEIPSVNAALGEVYQQWKALVRALYIEATGDVSGADNLSLDALRGEIQEKSPLGEHNLILQRIAQERAGLIAPPADLSKASPHERVMRAYLQLGSQTEAAIAKRLGPERAKEIRGDAWSSRSDWSGCPDPGQ